MKRKGGTQVLVFVILIALGGGAVVGYKEYQKHQRAKQAQIERKKERERAKKLDKQLKEIKLGGSGMGQMM